MLEYDLLTTLSPLSDRKGKSTQNNKHTPALMEMFSNSPRDEFTVWCETQVKAFKNLHIDGELLIHPKFHSLSPLMTDS